MQTYDTSLLSSIITNFSNNRTSTRGHNYLTKKYFSSDRMKYLVSRINLSIGRINDDNLRIANIKELVKLLKQEKKNVRECLTIEDVGSIDENDFSHARDLRIGINVDEYLNKLEASLSSYSIQNKANER